jgi:hypothetical protein
MSTVKKMDVSIVYEMFEKITGKLDKQTNNTVEPTQFDMTVINAVTERLEDAIEEVRKPAKIEHRHHHTIDIRSNWFFLSWVGLVVVILGSFWVIANQRQTISQYRDNNLKYRYIKMHGQTNEENLYRLERQFRYEDSIGIIREQVEKYEELLKEHVQKIERAKQNSKEIEKLEEVVKVLKSR